MTDHSKRDQILRHVTEAAHNPAPPPAWKPPPCKACGSPATIEVNRILYVEYACAAHVPERF